jgi:hypothetical protein
MNAYPDLPGPRTRLLARDAMVVLLLILFVWLGIRVYRDVDALSGLGRGVVDAGQSVQAGFSSAASAAANVPLGGDAIAGALRSVGSNTGGEVAAIGHTGERSAHRLAVVLGLLMWALPSGLLLGLVLPRRIRAARDLRDGRRALRGPDSEERRRLLAVRAVLTLPDDDLLRHSTDPGGDLLAGRYENLAAAKLETMGIRAP